MAVVDVSEAFVVGADASLVLQHIIIPTRICKQYKIGSDSIQWQQQQHDQKQVEDESMSQLEKQQCLNNGNLINEASEASISVRDQAQSPLSSSSHMNSHAARDHTGNPSHVLTEKLDKNENQSAANSDQRNDTSSSSAQDDLSSQRNKLIINYLPPLLTEPELKALFEPYGNMIECKLVIDKHTGKSFGYGFVQYESFDSTQQAIKHLNGAQCHQKRLKVSYARPSSSAITGANLYIRNLPRTITEEDLHSIFGPYGEIISSRLLCEGGVCKGVAFVRFDKRSSAEKAIEELNGQTPANCSQPIGVKFADTNRNMRNNQHSSSSHGTSPLGMHMPYMYMQQHAAMPSPSMSMAMNLSGMDRQTPGFTLFVFNLPPNIDDQALLDFFRKYPSVARAKVSQKRTRNGKIYGFVTLMNVNDAVSAINEMNEKQLSGYQIKVSFKTAPRRNFAQGSAHHHLGQTSSMHVPLPEQQQQHFTYQHSNDQLQLYSSLHQQQHPSHQQRHFHQRQQHQSYPQQAVLSGQQQPSQQQQDQQQSHHQSSFGTPSQYSLNTTPMYMPTYVPLHMNSQQLQHLQTMQHMQLHSNTSIVQHGVPHHSTPGSHMQNVAALPTSRNRYNRHPSPSGRIRYQPQELHSGLFRKYLLRPTCVFYILSVNS
eukprot:gene370-7855_t